MAWFSAMAVGLIYCGVGSVIFARGLAIADDETLAAQAGASRNLNRDALMSFCERRVDARYAWPMLGAGFALQLYGVSGAPASASFLMLALFALAIAVLWYGMMRGAIAWRQTRRIAAAYAPAEVSPPTRKARSSANMRVVAPLAAASDAAS